LEEGLGEVGDGAGGARFDVAADDRGEETAEGGSEVVGGEVFAGEEEGQIVGENIGGVGAGFLAGMEEAEVRVVGGTRGEALAVVGEGETTQRDAVLWMDRGHEMLLI